MVRHIAVQRLLFATYPAVVTPGVMPNDILIQQAIGKVTRHYLLYLTDVSFHLWTPASEMARPYYNIQSNRPDDERLLAIFSCHVTFTLPKPRKL